MFTLSRQLDRSDFILAWLDKRKYSKSHKDLQSYYESVYLAYCGAFGVDLEKAPDKGNYPDEDGLHALFTITAVSCERISSPFSGIMCGTPEITKIYQKYKDAFNHSASVMRNAHLVMMVELMELIWGDLIPHKVSYDELIAHGYPQGSIPDPIDYW